MTKPRRLAAALAFSALLVLVLGRRAHSDEPALPDDASDASPPASAEGGPDLAEALPADVLEKLGRRLAEDWNDPPEWADLAIAILRGDDLRLGTGWWKPADRRRGWEWLRKRFDDDGDGRVGGGELSGATLPGVDLLRRLDRDLDGAVTADDFDEPARRRSTPAQRMAERLFSILDRDSNGAVSRDELLELLARADGEASESLTPEDLHAALAGEARSRDGGGDRDDNDGGGAPPRGVLLEMLFRGELGDLEPGPALGDPAPPFSLASHDGEAAVEVPEVASGKPVVLIFGSFT